MFKRYIAILLSFLIVFAGVAASMRADDPFNARPSKSRSQRIVFGAKPNRANLEKMFRLPLDPFGNTLQSPIFKSKKVKLIDKINREEALKNGTKEDQELYRKLLGPTRSYIARKQSLRLKLGGKQRLLRPFQTPSGAADNSLINNPARDAEDRTQSETSAVVSGKTIAVSFNDSSGLNDNNLCGVSVSTDDGKTWIQSFVPTFPGGTNLGDGVLAADTKGNLYYANVSFDSDDRSTVGVSRSNNGGKSWKPLVDASPTTGQKGDFQDKEWIAVDRSPTSKFKDQLYVTWSSILRNGKVQIMLARSKKGGRKFLPPQAIAVTAKDGFFVQGSMAATGPNGEVYVTFVDTGFLNTDIRVVKSTDGGATFSAPVTIASVRNPSTPANGVFDSVFPLPSIAVDASSAASRGTVYVVFPARPQAPPDRSDVLIVRSADGGATWSAPVKLNDDDSVAEQLQPSIVVNEEGAAAAMWYDRRNDLANLSLLDVYATVSTDGGKTFSRNRRITNANWPVVPTPFNLRAGYHGDYHQIAARGKEFLFNWADDRSGKDSDVYIAFKTAKEMIEPSPDFILSARTSSQTIKPGGTAEFVIDVQAVDGAQGAINLEALPRTGLNFKFDKASVEIGTSAKLSVQATAEISPGPFAIGVTARQGDRARTTFARLTVLSSDPLAKLPQNITDDRSGSLFPASSIDGAGNINVVWLDDSPGLFSIFFKRSTDGGKTFSDPVMLPRNFDTSIGAHLIASNELEIYIAHLELFETPQFVFKVMLTRSIDGGKTFSPAKPVSEDEKLFIVPESFQMDSDGSLHFGAVTFQPPDPANPVFSDFDVKSTDGGATFTFNKIFGGKSPLSQPIVAVEGDGRTVRALFADFDRSRGGLLFAQSSDGGVTYSEPARIPLMIADLLFATAFFAPNNRTHIIYAEGSIQREEFRLFYTRSDDGVQFTAPVQINGDAVTVLSASIAADAAGNVAIAFEGAFEKFFDNAYLSRIYYLNSTDGGATFTKPKTFQPLERGGDFLPRVLLDQKGLYSIIWIGFSGDATDVFYSISTDKGRNFTLPVNLTNNTGFSSLADLAFDENGRIQALFQDNTGGSFDIFRIKLGPEP